MMTHAELCHCGACRSLDRRHPTEGVQLALVEQRTQHAPTEAEALASLFELAGKTAAFDRNGQRTMML
jgi:hypothetical protein